MADNPKLKSLTEVQFENIIAIVVGTRPSIVMFSPIIRELSDRELDYFVIHTGQHYSQNMDQQFFDDLRLPDPEYKFNSVKECTFHGEQTAAILEKTEKVLLEERPKFVLVGGDANFNLASALAARKLHMNVGHVEAGERSGDWRMPEEHNRVILDHISDYLFTTNETGAKNLVEDNVSGDIVVSGNPIVDAVYQNVKIAHKQSDAISRYGVTENEYVLITMHREENVDSKYNLENALVGIERLSDQYDKDFLFLAHPRTKNRIKEFELTQRVKSIDDLEVKDAVGYLDFLQLLSNAWMTLTDSGGVQQESCILSVPSVTLRNSTEWTETLDVGAATLTGTDPDDMVEGVRKMADSPRDWETPFGDGESARRIIDVIEAELNEG